MLTSIIEVNIIRIAQRERDREVERGGERWRGGYVVMVPDMQVVTALNIFSVPPTPVPLILTYKLINNQETISLWHLAAYLRLSTVLQHCHKVSSIQVCPACNVNCQEYVGI